MSGYVILIKKSAEGVVTTVGLLCGLVGFGLADGEKRLVRSLAAWPSRLICLLKTFPHSFDIIYSIQLQVFCSIVRNISLVA